MDWTFMKNDSKVKIDFLLTLTLTLFHFRIHEQYSLYMHLTDSIYLSFIIRNAYRRKSEWIEYKSLARIYIQNVFELLKLTKSKLNLANIDPLDGISYNR